MKIRSTTIIGIIKDGQAALGGDGQVTLGNTVMKHNSMKIRKLLNGKVLTGFAGSTADAFTLAKDWRTDKYLRKLEAMLAIISNEKAFIVSGTGDVIEPEDNIVAIGSGGMYALAAAKMLKKYSNLSAKEIVEESLMTAANICIYTNDKINVEVITK